LTFVKKKRQEYKESKTIMWDVIGDTFDNVTGTDIMKITNLSLDEHELERNLFVSVVVGASGSTISRN
jgi:predicted RNA-binding protein